MSYSITLSRLGADLMHELPIKAAEWEACVRKLEGTRLSGKPSNREIEFYNENHQHWEPLFWLDERGCAHSNALHYFGQEDLEMSRHLKGMQIAQCLNTYISGEEGSFFYIPGWHSYFWNDTDELEAVSIDELLEYRRQYDDDAGNMAERLKAIRAAMEVQAPPKLSTVSPSAPSRQSYQWLFWLMLLIAAYYLEQLLLF